MAKPRFSECSSSGQVTSHFLLMSSCVHRLEIFRDKEGLSCHPHPGERVKFMWTSNAEYYSDFCGTSGTTKTAFDI